MKKNIPGLLFVAFWLGLFVLLGISDSRFNYIVVGSGKPSYTELIIELIIAIAAGYTTRYWFKKVFPKGYSMQKRPTKVFFIPFISFLISLYLILIARKSINAMIGKQETVMVEGSVWRKNYVKGNKGGKTYYLYILSVFPSAEYKLRVSRSVYNNTTTPSHFEKEFRKGCFGIIYRKEL